MLEAGRGTRYMFRLDGDVASAKILEIPYICFDSHANAFPGSLLSFPNIFLKGNEREDVGGLLDISMIH